LISTNLIKNKNLNWLLSKTKFFLKHSYSKQKNGQNTATKKPKEWAKV
jgi:hypothetical protein